MPELKFKKNNKQFEYQPKDLTGKPDFTIRKEKLVVFIDGCFWHKCPDHYVEPKSNKQYWIPKIERNVKRDKEIDEYYKKKIIGRF